MFEWILLFLNVFLCLSVKKFIFFHFRGRSRSPFDTKSHDDDLKHRSKHRDSDRSSYSHKHSRVQSLYWKENHDRKDERKSLHAYSPDRRHGHSDSRRRH